MNADLHRSVAARNLKLYAHLRSKPDWSDWAMTVLFYAAHHELMAFLVDQSQKQPSDHAEMKDALARPEWKPLAVIHGMLLGRSYRARYKGGRYDGQQLDQSHAEVLKLKAAIAALVAP